MKKGLLLMIAILGGLFSFSQTSELSLLRPTGSEISEATGINKARMYYKAGKLKLAVALLYAELEKGNFSNNDFLLFANTLNADGKPALATEFYSEYLKGAGLENTNEATILETVTNEVPGKYNSQRVVSSYQINNPSVYDGELYSSNNNGELMKYQIDCEGNLSGQSRVLNGLTEMPFGKVAFFDNGQKAVAALIDETTDMSSLWLFIQKKGKWKKPKQLFSNHEGNYAFPSVHESTNTLYFASDREGGMGGFDIYVSIFDGKTFASILNVGKEINTAYNELNPTRTEDWLFFSSNGHISQGGYDIFKHNVIDDFNSVLGSAYSFNSKIDDLGLIPVLGNQYFSIQASEVGSYLNSFTKKEETNKYSGVVSNEEGEPIENAKVLVKTTDKTGFYTSTDKEGKYGLSIPVSVSASGIEIVAVGYKFKSQQLSSQQNIVLQKVDPVIKEVMVEVIVYKDTSNAVNDSTKAEVDSLSSLTPTPTPISNQSIKIDNPNVNKEGDVKTNDTEPIYIPEDAIIGSADVNSAAHQADRGLYYIIVGSSSDYATAFDVWTEWTETFRNLEILEYSNGLYRVGFYAGTTEASSKKEFDEAKKHKKDIWMLRPKS